jgi:penicillin-binding protein 1A
VGNLDPESDVNGSLGSEAGASPDYYGFHMPINRMKGLAVGAALLGLVAASCTDFAESLPTLSKKDLRFEPAQSSKVFAGDGSLLTTFHGEQDRTVVPLGQIPKHLQRAVIAIEDQRFYEHDGIDFKAIARAALKNITSGSIQEGGSTITQQYVKQAIIAPGGIAAKSYSRKIQEAALARQLEARLSKKEILGRYLNTIYLGQGAYGVQAASKIYFNKTVGRLTLDESALIAGLIQQPGAFDPMVHPQAAKRRRNLVLDQMIRLDEVTRKKAERMKGRPLGVVKPEDDAYRAPYFVDYVQKLLTYDPRFKMLGDSVRERTKTLFQGGLRIYTTVDPGIQRAAEDAISSYLTDKSGPYGSLVALDPRNGEVKAMVGGRDYFASGKKTRVGRFAKFNLAITGEPGLGPQRNGGESAGEGRQAGSAFKPFTLAAALEDGVPLSRTFQGGDCIDLSAKAGEPYRPCNYEGSAYGKVSLLEATVNSINIVYLQLGLDIGIGKTSEMAERLGIRTGSGKKNDLLPIVSAPLGPQPVNPLGMASAYGTFANNGIYHLPVAISRIYDRRSQKTIFRAHGDGREVLDPGIAYTVTSTLEEVITSGTGVAANPGRPAAGKTGTGQEYRDAWFAGYTPQLSAAVWVGHPEGEIAMPGISGGTLPAPIWGTFMRNALADVPVRSFSVPEGATLYEIDTRNGCPASESTPDAYLGTTAIEPAFVAACAPDPPEKSRPHSQFEDGGKGGPGNENGHGNGGPGNENGHGNGGPGNGNGNANGHGNDNDD